MEDGRGRMCIPHPPYLVWNGMAWRVTRACQPGLFLLFRFLCLLFLATISLCRSFIRKMKIDGEGRERRTGQ
jgi:hypothetical protein